MFDDLFNRLQLNENPKYEVQRKMAQNQNNNYRASRDNSEYREDSNFEVSNQGQNLGGEKGDSAVDKNPVNIQDQLRGEEDFRKTYQTI